MNNGLPELFTTKPINWHKLCFAYCGDNICNCGANFKPGDVWGVEDIEAWIEVQMPLLYNEIKENREAILQKEIIKDVISL